MVWLEFAASAVLISFAGIQLSKYVDVISLRTNLGGMFAGALLLGIATTLPELLTTISAVRSGVPDLAAGSLFGSNMFNMMLLAIMDLAHYKRHVSRMNAEKHALTGSLTVLMISLALFFIIAKITPQIRLGNLVVGVDALVLMVTYFFAMSLLRKQSRQLVSKAKVEELPEDLPSLRTALIWFAAAVIGLVILTPWMVTTSTRIAVITGLGASFIGFTLVAFVTSLPELVTTISAARIGADDMAIGNLFGSNMFNMFSIAVADFFLLKASFFAVIDSSFLLVGSIGLLMTVFALISTLARLERKIWFLEIDSVVLILAYFGGMAFLYMRGITP